MERRIDVRKAMATALDFASQWKIEGDLPLKEWRAEIDPEGAVADAVGAERAKREKGPVWLEPLAADPKGWPTVEFESALLRYSLRIPKRWPAVAEVRPVSQMETSHVLRGPWPTEWLIVSFMDKATPGGRIADWVDGISAITGFPVLEMKSSAGKYPKLLNWQYEGSSDAVANRLQVDETRCYSGTAQFPGEYPRPARVYILLVARAAFAWKITLAFESACLTTDRVATNDHIRAAAVFGALRLG